MATRQQTARSRRRQEELAEQRRNRIIVILLAVVLGLTAVILLVGLFVTQYLPPRAHIATIGGRDYNAAAVLRRAEYYMFTEGGISSMSTVAGFADFTLELLEREETLRQRAPALVGEVTAADIDADLRETLGFAEGTDEAGYGSALQRAINDSGLTRDEFDRLAEAGILMTRLREHFAPEEGATAAQVDLRRIRTTTEERARQAAERLAAGESADVIVAELGTRTEQAPVAVGWSVLDELDDEVRAVVENVEAGNVAEPVPAGVFWDVYFVAAREDERALDEDQRQLVATSRIQEWMTAERANVESVRDLSDSEATWIEDRLMESVLDFLREVGAA